MDRYEYKTLTDEARAKMDQGKSDEAAEILDSVNWRKVHNVNALVKAAGLYEEAGRLEDAKDLLLTAHERSPIGRMVIYRLALVCIRLGEFDEAREFYDEFVEIAPHDSLKYVIRYRLNQAKGSDDATLIAILEELKEQDFQEDWAYELAVLYAKTGQIRKCVELCDEIVLWFGDGLYVEKSLELKMKYSPLDPEQEDKYNRLRRQKQDEVREISVDPEDDNAPIDEKAADPDSGMPQVQIPSVRFNTVNLQAEIKKNIQDIMQAKEPDEINESIQNLRSLTDEIPYLKATGDTREMQMKRREQDQKKIDDNLKSNFHEYLEEEQDGQISMVVPDKPEPEEQVKGQMSISDIANDWEKTKRAAQAALEDADKQKLEAAKAQALVEANEIMDRLTGKLPDLSGITDTQESDKKALSSASAQLHEVAGAAAAGTAKDSDYREASHIMADVNDMLQREINRLQNENAGNDSQTAGNAASVSDTADIGSDSQEEEPFAESVSTENPSEEEDTAGIRLPENLSDVAEKSREAEAAAEAAAASVEEIASDTVPESIENRTDTAENIDVEPATSDTDENSAENSDATSNTSETSEDVKRAGELEEQPESSESDEAENTSEETEALDVAETSAEEASTPDAPEESVADLYKSTAEEAPEETASEEGTSEETAAEETTDTETEEPQRDAIEEAFRLQATRATWTTKNMEMNPVEAMSPENVFKADAYAQKPAADADQVPPLTEDEKKQFSYFIAIDGMDVQISRALANIKNMLNNGGHSGHLILCGNVGSGKTMFATSTIQVLQHEIHKPRGPVGTVKGESLNHKNVIMLFDKIKSGAMIIRNAADMSRVTVATLNALLDSDDTGTLVIIEDDPDGINSLLKLNGTFADKFSSRINIPIFTIDELVNFGRSYAKEKDCTVDEMAVLAMYNYISRIQRADHPTSLGEVRDLVDKAIANANEGGIRKAFSRLASKKYDKDGRLILREKDFDVE